MARAAPARPHFRQRRSAKLRSGDYSHEKGSSTLDLRHRVGIGFVWAPTLLHNNNAAAKYLANNWQFALLGTFTSSPPVTPTVQISTAPVRRSQRGKYRISERLHKRGLGQPRPVPAGGKLGCGEGGEDRCTAHQEHPDQEAVQGDVYFRRIQPFQSPLFTSVQPGSTSKHQQRHRHSNPAAGFARVRRLQISDGTNARRLQLGCASSGS